MAFITINYDEGNKEDLGYKSVELHYGKKEKKFFATGNFIKDWFDCKKFFNFEIDDEILTQSSSVNHFIMDGAPYDSAYLHMIDSKPVLKYFDRSEPNWFITQKGLEDGMELFVPENTQLTWEELKEMCK